MRRRYSRQLVSSTLPYKPGRTAYTIETAAMRRVSAWKAIRLVLWAVEVGMFIWLDVVFSIKLTVTNDAIYGLAILILIVVLAFIATLTSFIGVED